MFMRNIITEYIECECHSELLQIQYNEEDKEFYLSLYEYGLKNQLSFCEKIKYISKILKFGKLSQDGIILNKKETKKLKDFLEKFL